MSNELLISWERIRAVLHEQDKKGVTDPMFRLEAIAQAQLSDAYKKFYEWGNEPCDKHPTWIEPDCVKPFKVYPRKRFECPKCQEELGQKTKEGRVNE